MPLPATFAPYVTITQTERVGAFEMTLRRCPVYELADGSRRATVAETYSRVLSGEPERAPAMSLFGMDLPASEWKAIAKVFADELRDRATR